MLTSPIQQFHVPATHFGLHFPNRKLVDVTLWAWAGFSISKRDPEGSDFAKITRFWEEQPSSDNILTGLPECEAFVNTLVSLFGVIRQYQVAQAPNITSNLQRTLLGNHNIPKSIEVERWINRSTVCLVLTIQLGRSNLLESNILKPTEQLAKRWTVFSQLWLLEFPLTWTLTLYLDTQVVLVKQFGISKAEMKRWKVFHRLRSFFKGKEGVSAAQPIDVHDVQTRNESQMVDEHDRSTKLEDLKLEDWPLEDSFKLFSDFLDSMPSNTQDTEPEISIKTSSPSSVSSSKGFSLHETSIIQIYQKQNQQLEALEQQMDELSILLAQNEIRREKLLARVVAQMESINADVQIHLRSATINISNDAEAEPMTQPTKDMGVGPISLDTTTMCIADTLPEYHAGDNGLLESNLYSSDTKNERISISPSLFLSQDSVSNSHFPGTKSLLFTSQLLPSSLPHSIEPTSAERGLQDYIQVDQPIFIKWLHSGSTKSRPTGHRRGRPPRTSGELSWYKVLLSFHHRRRRGRPPRSVLLLPWSHRPKGHRRGRPPNNYHSLETDPASIFPIGCPDISCFLYVLLLSNNDAYPQPELHSISFQGGRRCHQSSTYHSAIFVSGIQVCLFLAILIWKRLLND